MPSSLFRFKKFLIRQDKCPMKVGTDGVLLGAWASLPSGRPGKGRKMLDAGTGTGLIALMLSQKLCEPDRHYTIDAVDIDPSSCEQAMENIAASGFNAKINVICQAYHLFAERAESHSYDLIVSNPPFFSNKLKSPNALRNLARHSDASSLNSETLIRAAIKLLAPEGNFSLILPRTEGENFITEAKKAGLYCSRLTEVFPKPGKECLRLLMQFGLKENKREETQLTIETGNKPNDFTEEYKSLTKEFYLNF
jgi:tRNA1Val (adenine37-N6)-methyltransferase